VRAARAADGQAPERVACVEAVLARGGNVAADRQEALGALRGAPAAGDLLLELDHSDVLLGLVVFERHPEVVGEAKHVGLVALQAQQQVMGLAALAGGGGVFFMAHRDDRRKAGGQLADRVMVEALGTATACPRDGVLGVQQQALIASGQTCPASLAACSSRR